MKSFKEIKEEISKLEIKSPLSESKYGKFLDTIVLGFDQNGKYDQRGKDKRWDLWYYSNNTEFCRDSAKYFLEKIKREHEKYMELQKNKKNHGFKFDNLRRLFGCFCFYLYAALESFAHEINIFYEINMCRRGVSITKIKKQLNKNYTLFEHLQKAYSDKDFKDFIDYRNALMHGYVYPISGKSEGLFLKNKPRNERFSFDDMDINIMVFCDSSYSTISNLICKGWRHFEEDELIDRKNK